MKTFIIRTEEGPIFESTDQKEYEAYLNHWRDNLKLNIIYAGEKSKASILRFGGEITEVFHTKKSFDSKKIITMNLDNSTKEKEFCKAGVWQWPVLQHRWLLNHLN